MQAKPKSGEFHWCEGCTSILDGPLTTKKGWKDQEGDWIADSSDYDSTELMLEAEDLDWDDVEEAEYRECFNGCDSDDGWEIDALDKIYFCGKCGNRYQSLEVAGDCCMPYSCLHCGTRYEQHHEATSCIVKCEAKIQEAREAREK